MEPLIYDRYNTNSLNRSCLDSDHEGNALKRLRSQTSAVFGVRNSAEVSDFCWGKAAEWCLEHGRGLRTRL